MSIYNKGNIDKIVSIPIYKDDDYYSILKRFVEGLGDEDVCDAFGIIYEEHCEKENKNNK